MHNQCERKKYKNIFEKTFKKDLNICIEQEEIEFNLELINRIANEYKYINSKKLDLSDSTYYEKEEIRLETIINQMKRKKYDIGLISKVINAIMPMLTFGVGTLVGLGNQAVSNTLSQSQTVQQVSDNGKNVELLKDTTEKINEAVNNYMNNMSYIIEWFIIFFAVLILITFAFEYLINNHNKRINERKLRFYEICLDTLQKVKEGKL